MRLDPARLRDLAVLLFVPLFFASNVVLGRFLVGEVAPWTLAFLRWFGAFAILLPFALPGILAKRVALARQVRWILLLGLLGMWVCGGSVYAALRTTTATNATLIYSASSVMILILERAFRGRRVTGREWAGTLLALAGVAVVALGGGARLRLNGGDVLIGLAALSWALYSVILKRPRLASLPTIPLFGAVAFTGSVLLMPMAMWEMATGPALPSTPGAWLAVAALALVPSVAAFGGYQYGIRRFGPGLMAMTSYLWMPYGVALAVLLLGETLRGYHVVGLALILPGVVLATVLRPASNGPARPEEAGSRGLDPHLTLP